jgi:hypothetical protein
MPHGVRIRLTDEALATYEASRRRGSSIGAAATEAGIKPVTAYAWMQRALDEQKAGFECRQLELLIQADEAREKQERRQALSARLIAGPGASASYEALLARVRAGDPATLACDQGAELERVLSDFAHFLGNYVALRDRGGTMLKPWEWQSKLARQLPGCRRLVILKARQLGIS